MVISSSTRIKSAKISATRTDAGLRIVILQIPEVEYSSNIVVKSGLRSLTQTPITSSSSVINSSANISSIHGDFNCFLRSCHLCNKPLSSDKDVYMYRGDQGFCSIECRSRQIMVDEMKEMEAKTKKRVAAAVTSSVDCHGCETCTLLEDLRQRRNRRNNNNSNNNNNNYKQFMSPTKHQQPLLSFS